MLLNIIFPKSKNVCIGGPIVICTLYVSCMCTPSQVNNTYMKQLHIYIYVCSMYVLRHTYHMYVCTCVHMCVHQYVCVRTIHSPFMHVHLRNVRVWSITYLTSLVEHVYIHLCSSSFSSSLKIRTTCVFSFSRFFSI